MRQLLASLPLLACPVGMGLMMWMMRGGNHDRGSDSGQQSLQPAALTRSQQAELTRLRAELDQLRAEDRDAARP